MSTRSVRYTPIGIIHSPLRDPAGAPIQSINASTVEGTVEVLPRFARGFRLTVMPFLDKVEHGVFSTRVPSRPNAIGMSVVSVLGVRGRRIRVRGLDVIDGTPLLDIKPYVPAFDSIRAKRIGWYAGRVAKSRVRRTKANGRFVPDVHND